MSMNSDPRPSQTDGLPFYQLVRSRLEHEDGLIVNRLSWLMASQSFLFTAYAVVGNGLASSQIEVDRAHHSRLIHLIPMVGIASSALIYIGILAAIRAIAWLRSQFRARGLDLAGLGLPPLQTPRHIMVAGLVPPMALPVVFVGVWLYLLLTHPW